jgi:hypothetical protein
MSHKTFLKNVDHQKIWLFSALIFLLLTLALLSPLIFKAYADVVSIDNQAIQVKNAAITQAILDKDYEAWAALQSDESLLAAVNAGNFHLFAEAYRLLEQGKIAEANLIKKGMSMKAEFAQTAQMSLQIQNAIKNRDYDLWLQTTNDERVGRDDFNYYTEILKMVSVGELDEAFARQRGLGLRQGQGGVIIRPFACGHDISFTYNGSSVTYGTVSGQNNTCWLDRNLGATRVAIAYNDHLGYGDLFQWGRGDDGHQIRTSGTTSTLSSSDSPGHSNFIISLTSPKDWRSPQNGNLWQGVSGINNPCPSGWRVPTKSELDLERASWSSDNRDGAFSSPLKWSLAGARGNNSSLSEVGAYGMIWSSSLGYDSSSYLYFNRWDAGIVQSSSGGRSNGFSVRCIWNGDDTLLDQDDRPSDGPGDVDDGAGIGDDEPPASPV